MERKKLISILLFVFSLNLIADDGQRAIIERFMKQREKMMKEMMDSFGDDSFFGNKSFFSDDLMNDFDSKFFDSTAKAVDIKKLTLPNKDIEVEITPLDSNIKLDIETSEQEITIKSKTVVEQRDESDQRQGFSKSMSQSVQSVGVPFGYEIIGPTQRKKSIVYILRKKKAAKQPLNKVKGDRTI